MMSNRYKTNTVRRDLGVDSIMNVVGPQHSLTSMTLCMYKITRDMDISYCIIPNVEISTIDLGRDGYR